MLSSSFEALVESIKANSEQKRACAEQLTQEIEILTATAEPKYEHLIEIMAKRRAECTSHAQTSDLDIASLVHSNDAGVFAHIYALLDAKDGLQMLLATLQV